MRKPKKASGVGTPAAGAKWTDRNDEVATGADIAIPADPETKKAMSRERQQNWMRRVDDCRFMG